MTTEFSLNGERVTVEGDAQKPLLWVLREDLALTGAKFGCGKGLCGACTVQVDGAAVRSCSFPLALAAGKSVTTIEGLGRDGLHAVQQAWDEMNTPQCGYCQPGQIMSAAALLAANATPSDADVNACMAGNVCRCGAYVRIRKAIHRAAAIQRGE